MADVADYSRGMHWIGHAGSLVPFKDRGSVSVTDDVEPSIQVSLGGVRRARVSRNRAPRSWSLSMPDAHADDVAHVRSLMTATLPPYQLVTAEAQVSNVLTPERSVMSDSNPELSLGGWWPIAGEYQGGGALVRLNPSAAFGQMAPVYIGPAPVPPVWTGREVTASVLVATARAEGAQVGLQWLNAAGNLLSTIWSARVTGMDGLRRVTATGAPPAGAVACKLVVYYAEVIAQPQVTWTDAPVEWTVGNGADAVVITGLDRDTELQVPDSRNLRRGDYSLNLTEVGP